MEFKLNQFVPTNAEKVTDSSDSAISVTEYMLLIDTCSQYIRNYQNNREVPTADQILDIINRCRFKNVKEHRRPFRQLGYIISQYLFKHYRLSTDFRSRPAEIKWIISNPKTRIYYIAFFQGNIDINELHALVKSEEGREKKGYDGLYDGQR